MNDDMIILCSNSKPIAVLVSLKNVDEEDLALSVNERFIDIIRKSKENIKIGKVLSYDEMMDRVSKMQ